METALLMRSAWNSSSRCESDLTDGLVVWRLRFRIKPRRTNPRRLSKKQIIGTRLVNDASATAATL